jgi:hypothetical protein
MSDILLQEATLLEICNELSKRDLNYILIARYLNGPISNTDPLLKFNVKANYMVEMLGLTDIAKIKLSDLILEFMTKDDVEEDV